MSGSGCELERPCAQSRCGARSSRSEVVCSVYRMRMLHPMARPRTRVSRLSVVVLVAVLSPSARAWAGSDVGYDAKAEAQRIRDALAALAHPDARLRRRRLRAAFAHRVSCSQHGDARRRRRGGHRGRGDARNRTEDRRVPRIRPHGPDLPRGVRGAAPERLRGSAESLAHARGLRPDADARGTTPPRPLVARIVAPPPHRRVRRARARGDARGDVRAETERLLRDRGDEARDAARHAPNLSRSRLNLSFALACFAFARASRRASILGSARDPARVLGGGPKPLPRLRPDVLRAADGRETRRERSGLGLGDVRRPRAERRVERAGEAAPDAAEGDRREGQRNGAERDEVDRLDVRAADESVKVHRAGEVLEPNGRRADLHEGKKGGRAAVAAGQRRSGSVGGRRVGRRGRRVGRRGRRVGSLDICVRHLRRRRVGRRARHPRRVDDGVAFLLERGRVTEPAEEPREKRGDALVEAQVQRRQSDPQGRLLLP